MTNDQIKDTLKQQLSDYFDGYVVIGVVAGERKVLMITYADSEPTRVALASGVCVVNQEIRRRDGFTG